MKWTMMHLQLTMTFLHPYSKSVKRPSLPHLYYLEGIFRTTSYPLRHEDSKYHPDTPIFKKGDKSEPANYRPISLTSHPIKIFERVIRKKIVDHLDHLESNKQHGFRKGRSCLTHLLKHIDDVIQSLLNDHDVIYLDFAKAFDKVDHEILIRKLRRCGIQGKLLNWIEQFLSERKQFVTINGFHSSLAL